VKTNSGFSLCAPPAAARRFAGSLNYDIAPGDAMLGGNHDHYFGDGASALSNILHALAVTDTTRARISISDVGRAVSHAGCVRAA
jgi:hypothetical protein